MWYVDVKIMLITNIIITGWAYRCFMPKYSHAKITSCDRFRICPLNYYFCVLSFFSIALLKFLNNNISKSKKMLITNIIISDWLYWRFMPKKLHAYFVKNRNKRQSLIWAWFNVNIGELFSWSCDIMNLAIYVKKLKHYTNKTATKSMV
jgi:hypothetical protein